MPTDYGGDFHYLFGDLSSLPIHRKLMNVGNTLKHPHQTDTYGCSICTISTIAHGVFGDPLWRQRDASTNRISWFLKLIKHGELFVSGGHVIECY